MMKKDGLSDAVIEKLIVERRALAASGRKVSWSSYKKNNPYPVPNTSYCNDIGVENGWATWFGAPGQTNQGNPCIFGTAVNPPVSLSPNTCFNLTSGSGIDPCTPGAASGAAVIPSVAPGFGNASIQIGCQQMSTLNAEQITYQMNITAQDTILVYTYALVFHDPGSSHAPNEQPFADFVILDQNGDTVPCSFRHHASMAGQKGWYSANSTCIGATATQYKPWTTVGVNLAGYVGQSLTVVITNADCSQGGHFAHSYWDFTCGSIQPKYCTGQPITLWADSVAGNTFQWYHNGIAYPSGTNASINPIPVAGDTFSVVAQQPSGCNFTLQYVPLDTCLAGVGEILNGNSVSIFPVPASRNLFLDFGIKNFGKSKITVCSLTGEKLYATTMPASVKQILDVSGYAEGIYFIKIETAFGNVTKKIVISR
jgi:hypothetical protein